MAKGKKLTKVAAKPAEDAPWIVGEKPVPKADPAALAKIGRSAEAKMKAAAAAARAKPAATLEAHLTKSEKRQENLNTIRGRRAFEKTIRGR